MLAQIAQKHIPFLESNNNNYYYEFYLFIYYQIKEQKLKVKSMNTIGSISLY